MISWTDLLVQSEYINPQRYFSFNTKPGVVVWNITSRCNLNCKHCYLQATEIEDPNELNTQEAMEFIGDLIEFKVPVLLFSGGEPLLRKDIFELAQFAVDKGIKVALSTNGTLINKEIAKEIRKMGFYYVGISIDGLEKTNDNFRQNKGAFKSSLSAIRNCQELGLKVGLRFTLTQNNFRDLPAIFELVEKEGISRFCIYHLVYTGKGKSLKDKDLTHQEKREVLDIIWDRTKEFFQKKLNIEVLTVDNHCDGVWIYLKLRKENPQLAKRALELLKEQGGNNSGLKIGCVDNKGNIYPDQFWRTHPLGNIRQTRFSDIWKDKDNKFLEALRNRKHLLCGRCKRCNFVSICNGNFRARAEAVFGDIWAEDPACYLTDEEIRTQWN